MVTNTLRFAAERCNNCGLCSAVCPHEVWRPGDRHAQLAHAERCMECGACQRNCAPGAITVDSGVGCAYAMFRSALLGRKEVSCCGDDEPSCCG
jgi:NAD-dependent dihydropyrimidine dehydrogenase PreA subunit